MDRWSRGRVVLLGDAAWCVTVFAGYGAALALDGADRLGATIAAHEGGLRTALGAWEEAMRPEIRKRQARAPVRGRGGVLAGAGCRCERVPGRPSFGTQCGGGQLRDEPRARAAGVPS
ncbi:FAD-dependent monooxygenase [Nocardia sp. BMG51109]|uniref:FAD-dependent monooxygenase n=1 Tax=Nocardia sp. BMG51109 TaxID=1056816 RepID=UPI0018DDA681